MARLIDLDKIRPIDFPSVDMDGMEVVNYLSTLPTADAVEVVRCKDCKHRADLLDNGNYLCNRKMIGMVRPSDFCSFAERQTDG